MNSWLVFILVLLVGSYLLEQLLTFLNLRALDSSLPAEFEDVFDAAEYQKSQEYICATERFGQLESSFSLLILLVFLLMGGFNAVDIFARGLQLGTVTT